MFFIVVLIAIYIGIYLTVFVQAHKDANMIKPLTIMTAGMLILLAITAIICLSFGYWYFSIIILIVILGLLNFLSFLIKY
ncbi:MAG: hypothetical protein IKL53_07005 [Lachnospiraceae bacterium]|nr:hypothetical protein [Lachnospiraceae bacterium]